MLPITKKTTAATALLALASVSLPADAGWELEWIDDFSGNGVNWQNWTAHIQANFNNEIQCYTDDESSDKPNLTVSDGTLKITAHRETVQCEGLNGQQKSWTSGRLVSKDKREFLYGRLEARLKFSTLDGGTWPAFWALENRIAEDPIKGDNDTVHWPNPGAGEIDICEWFSNDGNSYITNFFNTSGCGGEFRPSYPGGAADVLEFHTYAMEWSPDTVSFLMDDQVVHSVNISDCPQYKEPMYVLINVAIGGNLGGNVDPALNQATMEVDYIAHCTASDANQVTSCNEQTPRASDSDEDSVSDNLDTCPETPQGAAVDIDGCEISDLVQRPESTAPTPSHSSTDVISIFSDQYDNIADVNYDPDWGQSTITTQITIAENSVLELQGLNYQGIAFESNSQDLSEMDFLHFDYWTDNSPAFNFYLISPGPQETAYEVAPERGSWQGVDVPLSHFTAVNLTNVFQLKLDGSGTVFLDNIYFYKATDDSNGEENEGTGEDSNSGADQSCTDGFSWDSATEMCVENNIAPALTLTAYLDGQATENLNANQGQVSLSLEINDSNANDSHQIDWDATFTHTNTSANTSFEFDLGELTSGTHTVSVRVTDDGTPELTSSASMTFTVPESTEDVEGNKGGSSGVLLLALIGLLSVFRKTPHFG